MIPGIRPAKDPAREFRYFVFCDDTIPERESKDLYHYNAYYNMPISEYQCIEPNEIGQDCQAYTRQFNEKFEDKKIPGICVVL